MSRHKYTVCWENEHSSDGHDEPNLALAKSSCFEILRGWMTSFDDGDTSVDDWDAMIENCSAWVMRDEEDYWYPSDRQLESIGWVESCEMTDDVYKVYAKAYGWPKRQKGE